jgi:hypothetical protein
MQAARGATMIQVMAWPWRSISLTIVDPANMDVSVPVVPLAKRNRIVPTSAQPATMRFRPASFAA